MSSKNVEITHIPSKNRSTWRAADIISRQAFPATGNFDLQANAYGRLIVHNDDTISPGEGFDMHQHKDVDIVTWVVDGAIIHRDSTAGYAADNLSKEGSLSHGESSYISAGSGTRHSEVNAADFTSRQFLRVIQMWIEPEDYGNVPVYEKADVRDRISSGDLFLLAGPTASGAALTLRGKSACLFAGLLADATSSAVRLSRFNHIYVVRGRAEVAGQVLEPGDQLRITVGDSASDSETALITALEDDTELLIWVMDEGIPAK